MRRGFEPPRPSGILSIWNLRRMQPASGNEWTACSGAAPQPGSARSCSGQVCDHCLCTQGSTSTCTSCGTTPQAGWPRSRRGRGSTHCEGAASKLCRCCPTGPVMKWGCPCALLNCTACALFDRRLLVGDNELDRGLGGGVHYRRGLPPLPAAFPATPYRMERAQECSGASKRTVSLPPSPFERAVHARRTRRPAAFNLPCKLHSEPAAA